MLQRDREAYPKGNRALSCLAAYRVCVLRSLKFVFTNRSFNINSELVPILGVQYDHSKFTWVEGNHRRN